LQTLQKFQARCKITCSCSSKEPVTFVCMVPDCPVKQPLYCLNCLTEGDHSHVPNVKIEAVLKSADEQWSNMKMHMDALVKSAIVRYRQLEPVILHFEDQRKALGI